MNSSTARSRAVANFEAARKALIAAKDNYAAARKLLRHICPEAFSAVSTKGIRASVVGEPGIRARRRAMIARVLQNSWDHKFDEESNIHRAIDQAKALGLYASSSADAYWPIRRVAAEIGLVEELPAA